ncbi:peroxiredoxin [Pontiella sp.]|uniref:peroxiredoxin n=1 Tax=Pontiella sp. TaxID=2837462 RepID=UPI0035629415
MKLKILWLAILALPLAAVALEPGDDAPRFELMNQDGERWALGEHLGGRPIVIYFYPAAMTGGCTKQACTYRDYMAGGSPAFEVVGISADAVEGLRHFRTAENLNFPLLSDPEGRVAQSFGVTVKPGEKMITRTVGGKEVELVRTATTARWTFVVSPEGVILYKSDQVKPTEDLQNVLSVLQNIPPQSGN